MNRYVINQSLARLDPDIKTLATAARKERMAKGKLPFPPASKEQYDSCMFRIAKLLTDSCFHPTPDRPWAEHSDLNHEEIRVAEAVLRLLAYADAKGLDVTSGIREIFAKEDWD